MGNDVDEDRVDKQHETRTPRSTTGLPIQYPVTSTHRKAHAVEWPAWLAVIADVAISGGLRGGMRNMRQIDGRTDGKRGRIWSRLDSADAPAASAAPAMPWHVAARRSCCPFDGIIASARGAAAAVAAG